MVWDVDARAQTKIKDIASAVKGADKLILATDPDREGEAISWHILEVLKQKHVLGKMPVERVVFNAVTKSAILEAIAHPRADQRRTGGCLSGPPRAGLSGRASRCRRCLWRKLPGARSAGRVQSVALRLVVEREAEIEAFKAQEYWSIDADVSTDKRQFRRPPDPAGRQEAGKAVAGQRGRRQTRRRPRSRRSAFPSAASRPSRSSAIPRRPSSPRPCSRKPRASWASTPSAPCRWRRAFMKAWISAAKPSA